MNKELHLKRNTRIVIVIPHFNFPEGLEASVSTINESFSIDIIVVDDGSKTLPNESKTNQVFNNDGEIIYEYLNENSGIGVALNLGLEKAKALGYEFIARLDCGDYNKPDKFLKQLQYLDKNKDVMLLGTWGNVVDDDGNFIYELKHPTHYEDIKKKMYLNNTFLHPSIMFRTSVLDATGNYPHKYRRASQDYAFIFNVLKEFKVENYPEILIDYVTASNSISTTKRRLQVKNRIRIILDNFYFGFYPIYGLIRNIALLFVSRKFTTTLKKRLKLN